MAKKGPTRPQQPEPARRRTTSSGKSSAQGDGTSEKAPRPGRNPARDPVVVGKRNANPTFLLVIGVLWIIVGISMFFTLKASWKLIPGIVGIGIGLFFIRSGSVQYLADRRRR